MDAENNELFENKPVPGWLMTQLQKPRFRSPPEPDKIVAGQLWRVFTNNDILTVVVTWDGTDEGHFGEETLLWAAAVTFDLDKISKADFMVAGSENPLNLELAVECWNAFPLIKSTFLEYKRHYYGSISAGLLTEIRSLITERNRALDRDGFPYWRVGPPILLSSDPRTNWQETEKRRFSVLPNSTIESLHTVIQKKPNSASLHFRVADILLGMELVDEASDAFRKAIVHAEPSTKLSWFSLALDFEGRNRLNEAIEGYRKAIASDPIVENSMGTASYHLGMCLSRLGRYEEGIEVFQRSIETVDHRYIGFLFAYLGLGKILLKLRRLKEAANAFEKACKLKEDFAEAFFYLGICVGRLQDVETARPIALKIDNSNIHHWFYLGVRVGESENCDERVEELLDHFNVNPYDPVARFNLEMSISEEGPLAKMIGSPLKKTRGITVRRQRPPIKELIDSLADRIIAQSKLAKSVVRGAETKGG